MNTDDFIEDGEGNKIYYLHKEAKYFYRKITLLYGETESGKSTIIMEIAYLLRNRIPNVLIFAPTNGSNNIYTGKVGSPAIFNKLSMEILAEINARQKRYMPIYAIANDMENMKSVFMLVANDKEKMAVSTIYKSSIRCLNYAAGAYRDPAVRDAEEQKIKAMRDESLVHAYKMCIKENYKILLANENLTKAQKIAVRFYNFKPDLLLIFDDCASFFNENKKHPIIQDMFYQGRHDGLTSIFSFQGDKDIPPNLRRSAHNAIFTTSACAMAHFGTGSNGYDRYIKKRIELAIERIFRQDGEGPTHRKLIYLRGEIDKIKCILAKKYESFTMGGLWVRKYLESIQPKSVTEGVDKNIISEILSIMD